MKALIERLMAGEIKEDAESDLEKDIEKALRKHSTGSLPRVEFDHYPGDEVKVKLNKAYDPEEGTEEWLYDVEDELVKMGHKVRNMSFERSKTTFMVS